MAATFGASQAKADSILSFAPSFGYSDSQYAFGGSLTFIGGVLTSWDLRATCPACNPASPPVVPGTNYLYAWTPTNSTFTSDATGTGFTISPTGQDIQPKAWVGSGTFGNYPDLLPLSQLSGGDNIGWNFNVTWAYGGVYANGGTNITVAAIPEPETYAMLLAGLGFIGAVARRRRLLA
jgi:hypothetical protein